MAGTYARILSRITLDSSQFTKEMKDIQRKAAAMSARMTRIGTELSTAFTLPVGLAGVGALKSFAEYDSLRKALSTMEPTAESLQRRLEKLREVAKQPGLSFQEAIQGDVRLRAVGISAEQSARILKEFGNAIAQTGGGAAELGSVTTQLGQLSAKGKVFAQDLKPIIEAAPVVGKALKDMFGTVDSESIQKALADQGKGSKEFIEELLDKLAKAPRVTGGFKNAIENARDAIFVFGATIGESINKSFNLEERLEAMTNKLGELGDKWSSLPPSIQKFALGTTGAAASVGPLLIVLGKIVPMFTKGGAFDNGLKILKDMAPRFKELKGSAGAFLLLAIAIGANMENIVGFIKEQVDYFKQVFSENKNLRYGVAHVALTIKNIVALLGFASEIVTDLAKLAGGALFDTFRNIRDIIFDAFGLGTFNLRSFGKEAEEVFKKYNIYSAAARKEIEKNKVSNEQLALSQNALVYTMDYLNTAMAENQKVVAKLNPVKKFVPPAATKEADKYTEIIKKLKDELGSVELRQKTFGAAFDGVAFQIQSVERAINDLIELGTKKALVKIPELTIRLNELNAAAKSNAFAKYIADVNAEIAALPVNQIGKFDNVFDSVNDKVGILVKGIEGIDRTQAGATEQANKWKNEVLALENSLKRTISGKWTVEVDIKGNETFFDKMGEIIPVDAIKKSLQEVLQFFTGGFIPDIEGKWSKMSGELGKKFAEIMEKVAPIAEGVFGIIDAVFANKNATLDNFYENEKKKIEQSGLNEKDKAAAMVKLDEQVAAKRRKIQRDEAKAAKAKAIFEAVINGASAVISALKFGPIFAAIVGGLAAVQTAVIASAPLPALAKGGLAYKPITALVGDNPNARYDPEVIAPLSKLKNMLGNAGGGNDGYTEAVIRGADIRLVSNFQAYLDKRIR